jgi:pimeloyl-ACP methyl ester carboxylesterase
MLALIGPRWFSAMNLQQVYAQPSRLTPDVIDRYWELTLRPGNRQAFLDRTNLVEPDATSRLGEIHAPTLVMWGDHDLWIPVPMASVFSKAIPGARLAMIPDAGHVPMEERPAETAAIAKAFVLH